MDISFGRAKYSIPRKKRKPNVLLRDTPAPDKYSPIWGYVQGSRNRDVSIGKEKRVPLDKGGRLTPGPSAYNIPSSFTNKWNQNFNQVFSLRSTFHNEKNKEIKSLKNKI